MNQPHYLGRLTLADVRACAVEAERLFQRDPHVVPARTAAAWWMLAERMESAAAAVVADLGPRETSKWETELGFVQGTKTWDDDWPRDRASVARVPRTRRDEN